ncbi:hypothetical protein Nepgr_011217 [Nepenthes gracilis]|uniref:SnoaL-like domain-containing protein n=1 Tax=Nepenthes gracilis TaxID=150966 RepID=A0AAD3XM67_NEPGR|nr:hypothetical protein Nepgr_011217 [Nepenthes gracilis]
MSVVMGFPAAQKPPSSIFYNETRTILPGSLASRRTHQLNLSQTPVTKQGKPSYRVNDRKLKLMIPSAKNSGSEFSIASLSETIKKFYTCINEKKLDKLAELFADDCCLDDSFFADEFQGKKEVVNFFSELMASMGENVHFRIGHVCEGDELVACIDWYLEWKDNQIPFTRGCSLFQCSKKGETLLIKKARIVIESPIKPGRIVMVLLKILTSIFDEYPKAAEWFLKSPRAILQTLQSIYNLFLAPFINPVLACYVKLLKLMTWLLFYIFRILHYMKKLFKQRLPSDDSND